MFKLIIISILATEDGAGTSITSVDIETQQLCEYAVKQVHHEDSIRLVGKSEEGKGKHIVEAYCVRSK